eukprot:m.102677 g.102677  ORF g.102677 m.102677 type:complete len:117 (+) comp13778_c0_seq3:21-371(+)
MATIVVCITIQFVTYNSNFVVVFNAAYAIIICSAVNYAFMAAANKFLEASTCGLYGLVQPIATVALSYAIFGDLVKVHDLIGAVCICLGLILVSRAQLSEQRRQYTLIDGEGSEIN